MAFLPYSLYFSMVMLQRTSCQVVACIPLPPFIADVLQTRLAFAGLHLPLKWRRANTSATFYWKSSRLPRLYVQRDSLVKMFGLCALQLAVCLVIAGVVHSFLLDLDESAEALRHVHVQKPRVKTVVQLTEAAYPPARARLLLPAAMSIMSPTCPLARPDLIWDNGEENGNYYIGVI